MADAGRLGGLMCQVTTSDGEEIWISMDHVVRIWKADDDSSEVVQVDGKVLRVIEPKFSEWFTEEWLR